jgi:hypothetical protein
MNDDDITIFFRKSINFLFVSNPQGTALGVLVGVLFQGVMGVLSPLIEKIISLQITAFKLWHSISLGVIAFNIKPYLNRNKVDPKIESAIAHIKELEESGKISEVHAKMKWLELSNRVVESVTLKMDNNSQNNHPETQE